MDLFADWELLTRVDAALTELARTKQVELPAGRNPRDCQVRAAMVQTLLHPTGLEPTDRRLELAPALKELSARVFSDAKTIACVRREAGRWVRRYPRKLTLDELVHDVLRRLYYVCVQNAGKWFALRGPDADATWWGWVYLQIPELTDRAARRLLPPSDEQNEGDLPVGPDTGPGPRLDSLARDRNKLPHELASDREDAERLRRALDQLAADQRQAVTMKFVDENTYGEIATHFRLSIYYAKQLVTQGLINLRRLMGGIEP